MPEPLAVFWGCTIAHRLPFVEAATRRALAALGVEVADVPGVSCCPDPLYARMLGEETTLTLSARNLALAAAVGPEVLVTCNGCYQSLGAARAALETAGERARANERLAAAGCRYDGGAQVLHILQLLRRLGGDAIKGRVTKPLTGLRVAAHYGCHALSPVELAADDAEAPHTIEDVLRALGAEPVEYEERLSCCGGSLVAFDEGASAQLLRRKTTSLTREGADAVVVTCPNCYLQFDLRAKMLDEELRRPVFHLAELMCLAFGVAAKEMRFKGWHAVKVDAALARAGAAAEAEDLRAHFDVASLAACCGSCAYECTVVRAQADVSRKNVYDPMEVIRKVVAGEIDDLLASREIWYCLGCHECTRRCPHNRGLAEVFETLRRLAIGRGVEPPVVMARVQAVCKTGISVQKQDWAREEFGLAAAPEPDMTTLAQIINAPEENG